MASSAPFFLASGVKQVPAKKEDLVLRFSIGWAEVRGVERGPAEGGGVGEEWEAKDCAWRVNNFC